MNDHDKLGCEKSDLNIDDYDMSILAGFLRGFLKILVLWIIIIKERIHGYEIIKMLNEGFPEKQKKHGIEGPGSNRIYPILHELEKKGLIKGNWELQGKRKVKYYKITIKGENTINLLRNKPKKTFPPILKEFMFDVLLNEKNFDVKNSFREKLRKSHEKMHKL